MLNVQNIRDELKRKFQAGEFVTDKSGVKTVEIVSANFIADEAAIFGEVTEYADRELEWYRSKSLNVNDIPFPVPAIWKQVADADGYINSNYGWCIFSDGNGNQYDAAVKSLVENPDSRRSTMIYIRPSMQTDFCKNGMSDFMCTYSTQHLIRDNKLHYIVFMRSNDAWAGYRNDFHWHKYVHAEMFKELQVTYPDLTLGDIIWNSGSLHVYSRQFYLLDHYIKTGKTHISKADYDKSYGLN